MKHKMVLSINLVFEAEGIRVQLVKEQMISLGCQELCNVEIIETWIGAHSIEKLSLRFPLFLEQAYINFVVIHRSIIHIECFVTDK